MSHPRALYPVNTQVAGKVVKSIDRCSGDGQTWWLRISFTDGTYLSLLLVPRLEIDQATHYTGEGDEDFVDVRIGRTSR